MLRPDNSSRDTGHLGSGTLLVVPNRNKWLLPMTIGAWDIVLTVLTLVFMIGVGSWLKYVVDRQFKSQRRHKDRRK